MKQFDRRDFLKLMGLISATNLFNQFPFSNGFSSKTGQNVLIFVFDAFSAHHLPFSGYGRNTMPYLSSLLDKAIVYHNHYATSNFTTPGTASLLTGTYPWAHRAFNINGKVTSQFVDRNIFSVFDEYSRMGYSHNPYVNNFFLQFREHIDLLTSKHDLFLNYSYLFDVIPENDWEVVRFTKRYVIPPTQFPLVSSLYLRQLFSKLDDHRKGRVEEIYSDIYPGGIPAVDQNYYFLLEHAIDLTAAQIQQQTQPFFGYFHYFPPHDPYRYRYEFNSDFEKDDYPLVDKPLNLFSGDFDPDKIYIKNLRYDRSILYLDFEFNRLYKWLESNGFTENTWIIFTSDHGELFERGVIGHTTPYLYEPLIKIPLVIFEPGRTGRLDIHTRTSATDILPTVQHLTGYQPQNWIEGQILPPYNSTDLENRSVFSIDARENPRSQPLETYSAALIKENFKLIKYIGYQELDAGSSLYEFYDLENDPQELNDLADAAPQEMKGLIQELDIKIEEVNAPYKS